MKEQVKNFKIDLTWILYLGYAILLVSSFGLLPESVTTAGIWAVSAMLIFINLLLALGVMTAWYAIGQIKKTPQFIKTSTNKQKQNQYIKVLIVEVIVLLLLLNSPLSSKLSLILNLVFSKVVMTAVFLYLHYRLREIMPKK